MRSAAFNQQAPDNPPPRKRDLLAEREWSPNVVVVHIRAKQGQSVDDPPKRARLPEAISPSWASSWQAQSKKGSAAWDFTAAPINPPPIRQQYEAQRIAGMWAVTWGAQRAAPSAAWNIAVKDAPPPRNLYAQQSIAAMWVTDWSAQWAKPTAGWNVAHKKPIKLKLRDQVKSGVTLTTAVKTNLGTSDG